MKVLLDQNISHRILPSVKKLFKQAEHVAQVGLDDTDDIHIRKYAKEKDFSIITFDKDFVELASLFGVPPKVIWIRLFNPSNAEVTDCLESNIFLIQEFLNNLDYSMIECLELR